MTCITRPSPHVRVQTTLISHRLGILCFMGEVWLFGQAHIYGHDIPSDFAFSNDAKIIITSLHILEKFQLIHSPKCSTPINIYQEKKPHNQMAYVFVTSVAGRGSLMRTVHFR